MGVQGLWDLVSPAGQRVNLSALENKVIAVDASIWLYHFLKAMRDEHGNMVKGAHLLGFFRRICKLLYLKIKPVFVFDGPPPTLKLHTLKLRAQHRDSEERNRRKAVEKLLRNQLKMHVLEATMESAQQSASAGSAALQGNSGNAADDAGGQEDELRTEETAAQDAGDGEESDKSAGSHVEEVPPDTDVPAGGRRWQRRQWRRRQGGDVPQAFRGFMAKRRGVSEVVLPELPDEPLRDILQVPDRRRGRASRMSEPDEWKGYVVPGGGMVTIPLDGPVALEDFQVLSPKTRYTLLQRAQEAWYGESRLKAVEAKDDMGAFVNVQLETFLRHIRTNKEIEKVKRAMAEEASRPVNNGVVEGDLYTPPSWLQPSSSAASDSRPSTERETRDAGAQAGSDRSSAVIDELRDPGAAAESADAPASRASRRKGRGRGARQLDGSEVIARLQPVEHFSTALRDCLGEAADNINAGEQAEERFPDACSHEKPMDKRVTGSVDDLFGSDFFQGDEGGGTGSESEDVRADSAASQTPVRARPGARAQLDHVRNTAMARSATRRAVATIDGVEDLFDSALFHHDDGEDAGLPAGSAAMLTPPRSSLTPQAQPVNPRRGAATSSGTAGTVAISDDLDDLLCSQFFNDDERQDVQMGHAAILTPPRSLTTPRTQPVSARTGAAASSGTARAAATSDDLDDLLCSDFFHDENGKGNENEGGLAGDVAMLTPPRSAPSAKAQSGDTREETVARSETTKATAEVDDLFGAGFFCDDEGGDVSNRSEDVLVGDAAICTPPRRGPMAKPIHGRNEEAARSESDRAATADAVDDLFGTEFLSGDEVAHVFSSGEGREVDVKAKGCAHADPEKDRLCDDSSDANVALSEDGLHSRGGCTLASSTAVKAEEVEDVALSEDELHTREDCTLASSTAVKAEEVEDVALSEDGLYTRGDCPLASSTAVKAEEVEDVALSEDGLHTGDDCPLASSTAVKAEEVEDDSGGEVGSALSVDAAQPSIGLQPERQAEMQQASPEPELQPQLQGAGLGPNSTETPPRRSSDRSRSRGAARGSSDLPSMDAAKPVPAQQVLGHRPRQVREREPKADAWCTVHFQYSWRCREDGLDCAAAAAAAPGGTRETSAGASAQQRSSARKAPASDAARGQDQGDVGGLADEDLEDLEFQRLQAELEDERRDLQGEMHRAKRNLETVTPEMQADVERLLEAFGIPFIHSPAEAEAQCVFLAESNLVDAVATDDSDALVFGAREIYRRLFSEDHMVECYTAARVEERLGLLRNDLIALAMLLGCDYSLGVHGVGIVNGLEIVRAFAPKLGSLEHAAPQEDVAAWMEQLGHLQSWAQNVADWGQDSAGVDASDPKHIADFKVAHRNFRTQWSFPTPFPHAEVFTAFADPVVDRSLERPIWGSVDDDKVVRMIVAATSLGEDKLRERLDPALQRYKDTLRQPRITEYMVPTGVGDVAVVRSNRMRNALRGLRGETSPDRSGPDPGPSSEPEAKRAAKRRKASAKSTWSLRPNEGGPILLDLDL